MGVRVIICSYPGIYSDLMRHIFCRNENIEIVGFIQSKRIMRKNETFIRSTFRLIRNSGLQYTVFQFFQTTLYLILKYFLCRQIDVCKCRTYKTQDINDVDSKEFIRQLQPDVIILANFNQKLSQEVISIPNKLCLNIHPSALPKFKGVDPVVEAMAQGCRKLGVSIHKVDNNFDTGDIVFQKSLDVECGKSVFYHQFELFKIGAFAASKIVDNIENIPRKIIANMAGDYYSWPDFAKIKKLKKDGVKLIKISDYYFAMKTILSSTDC